MPPSSSPRPGTANRIVRVVAAAALVTVLADSLVACGGSGTPPATEQWQDSLCSAMDDWVNQITGYAQDIRSQLRSPSAGTATEIQATVQQGLDATDQLATELQALGPPPGENGQTAKALVDGLATDIQRTVSRVQQEAAKIPSSSSLGEAVSAIGSIAGEISAAAAQAQSTVESLQELGAEYEAGFEQIDSCKRLQEDFP